MASLTGRAATANWLSRLVSISGSDQEFHEARNLCGFLERDEFGSRRGPAVCPEQQVAKLLGSPDRGVAVF